MNQTNRYPKITAETPLEVVREIHRYIWDYAAENSKKPITPYMYDCVACEYAYAKCVRLSTPTYKILRCSCCPIDWRTISYSRTCHDIYRDWCRANEITLGRFNFNKKAHIAKKIRDVKFKTEEK